MLTDQPRQDAYRNAILNNKPLFKDKVVLDVGCGTGILSIFCAQAGAKKVLAVEASNLAGLAREVVKENGFVSTIQVFQSKIEDFELPEGVEDVDIIVSEWMGFYLLHEGMLDSVLFARDKFLRDGGYLFPETASIYMAPCALPSRFDQWSNVSGVKMSSFAKHMRQQKSQKPEVAQLAPESLLSDGSVVAFIDLKEASIDDLNDFQIKEVIVAQKSGKFQGVCIWFDVNFPSTEQHMSVLSTGPADPVTHWKQSTIVLPDEACQDDVEVGEPIALNLVMKRSGHSSRRYDLTLSILDADKEEHNMPCDCILTKCILTKAHLMSMEVDN
jgi:SAM-dependent methyltransferase